mmetsp:Transcript_10030/g.42642  ORF Transcript_10030/g.42642 Transcript_10030/m.42642 type:complete len:274 (-) Transcript_10030:9-830(-)
MLAASAHSTKNVLSPASRRSLAPPSRVNTTSAAERVKETHGVGAPICASTTATHAARSKVDFPPMFGPVRSTAVSRLFPSWSTPPSDTSLGTALSSPSPARVRTPAAAADATAQGFHSARASKTGASRFVFSKAPSRTNLGRHVGPAASAPNAARAQSASSSADAVARALQRGACSRNRSRSASVSFSASRSISTDASGEEHRRACVSGARVDFNAGAAAAAIFEPFCFAAADRVPQSSAARASSSASLAPPASVSAAAARTSRLISAGARCS